MNVFVNFKYIIKKTGKWTFGIYSVVGVLCFFVDFQGLLNTEWSFVKKIVTSIIIFLSLFFIVLIISILIYGFFIKKVKKISAGNKNSVYICYGDIFKFKKKERRNLVIAVNRCFDTIVDNKLISEKSLHGQLFNNLYDAGIYNVNTLNNKLQSELNRNGFKYNQLQRAEKPSGNLNRYPLGTTIELKNNLETYFLMGLSSLDKDLAAHITLNEYIFSINKIIDYCYEHSQGFPVIMPLVGGGLSRSGISEKDILQLILTLLEINKSKIVSDFYIIVNSNISITE